MAICNSVAGHCSFIKLPQRYNNQGMLVLSYPSYSFQRWHGTLLLYAILLFSLFVNTFLGRELPFVESSILVIHIVGVFVIMIPIAYLSPEKASAHDVFVLFFDKGGYNDKGLAFFVGIIATIFSFVGKSTLG